MREACISLGGRPSLPLERIRELIPKYSFENDGTVSKGAFAKLIEYLGKGHNVVDEMDAVYNKLAASRSKCQDLEAEVAALRGGEGAPNDGRDGAFGWLRERAIKLIDAVLGETSGPHDLASLFQHCVTRAQEINASSTDADVIALRKRLAAQQAALEAAQMGLATAQMELASLRNNMEMRAPPARQVSFVIPTSRRSSFSRADPLISEGSRGSQRVRRDAEGPRLSVFE